MTGRVFLKPRAETDILEHEAYLYLESPSSADRLVTAIIATAHRLAEHPHMGSVRHFTNQRLHGVRSWPVDGFPSHLLVYREVPEGVELLRVIHAAQDIGRFAEKLE